MSRRVPHPDDSLRWQTLPIGGRPRRMSRPVTFTPYASVQACSARCVFCSENLRLAQTSQAAATLRPGARYLEQLGQALTVLRGVEMGYSLSGLEYTDSPPWMLAVLDLLEEHKKHARITERTLYTNAAGFASDVGDLLMDRLKALAFRVEVSRHFHQAAGNQAIMRFRPGIAVADQLVFESILRKLATKLEVSLVCIAQAGGVQSAAQVLEYLTWARDCGVRKVIFREFSRLGPAYQMNAAAKYIAKRRVTMGGLLAECLEHPALATHLDLSCLTDGYYFWNLTGTYHDLDVTFESSDYATMLREHASGRIYKLVFHANGNLCAGWNPVDQILWSANSETKRATL